MMLLDTKNYNSAETCSNPPYSTGSNYLPLCPSAVNDLPLLSSPSGHNHQSPFLWNYWTD